MFNPGIPLGHNLNTGQEVEGFDENVSFKFFLQVYSKLGISSLSKTNIKPLGYVVCKM